MYQRDWHCVQDQVKERNLPQLIYLCLFVFVVLGSVGGSHVSILIEPSSENSSKNILIKLHVWVIKNLKVNKAL